jgi:serine protease Do
MPRRIARGGLRRDPYRSFKLRLGVALVFAAVPVAAFAQTAPNDLFDKADLKKLERTFIHIAEQVQPSVVAIETLRALTVDGQRGNVPNNHGTGFIIRPDGRILTNHHVIEGADAIRVTLSNGKQYDAQVVQFDPRSDLAVIRIDGRDLPAVQFGDTSAVVPGQWAFTVGNPFGLANSSGKTSFSPGVIEALGRSLTDHIDSRDYDRNYGDLLQTTAAINPGNSGGPVINIEGQVIGIATAMVSSTGVNEGLGFAIPVCARTRRVIDLLADGQVVQYGFLGVKVEDAQLSEAQAQGVPAGRGARVATLTGDPEHSPAARAGLQRDDIIISFDGTSVIGRDDLIGVVGATPIGRDVEIVYYRQGQRRMSRVTLAERAETAAARDRRQPADEIRASTWRGLTLVEPTNTFLAERGFTRQQAGLFVFAVPRESAFYRAGLREESMIVRLDGQPVRSLAELREVEKYLRGDLRIGLSDGSTMIVPK